MNDEELRRRYRRDFTREPIGDRRISPPPSPQAPSPTSSAPPVAPKPSPAVELPEVQPLISDPEHRPRRVKRKRRVRKKILLAVILILLLVGGGFFGYQKLYKKDAVKKHYFPSYITKSEIQIPVYYPVDLPTTFKVNNDYKVLQQDVLYYSVSNKAGDKFYITIQKLPTNFDFEAFKKKFVKPDEYTSAIGANLVGPAGGSLIGSIRTNQNVWIILNSTAVGSVNDMETITRSLLEVSL
jgi:hypothetical protein